MPKWLSRTPLVKGALAVALVFVLAIAALCLRTEYSASRYQRELRLQWRLMEDAFGSEVLGPLALRNVWGNVVQTEFYPYSDDAQPFARMRELTYELEETLVRTRDESHSLRAVRVYDLLAAVASDADFVDKHRVSDETRLAAAGVP